MLTGLTDEQVNERIAEGKVNADENPNTRTYKQIIRENTLTFFNFLNLVLLVLVLLVGSYKNAFFVCIIVINTLIGIAQEIRAKKTIDKLAILTARKSARVPYGSKSRDTVIRYSRQIIHFLKEQQVKAIVIACNTASAFALDAVQHEQDIPVLGVIGAGAKVAAEETVNKRVGVIGTVGTVGSGIHEAYLKKLDPEITVIGKACPLFVPLVEEGWLHDPVTVEVANRYLQELKDKDVDTLILGCTHYPLIRSTIREVMGEKVRLVNPAYETALELKNLLQKTNMLSTGQQEEEFPYRFYVSDLADEFKEFANSILPYDVEMTKKIDIEKY